MDRTALRSMIRVTLGDEDGVRWDDDFINNFIEMSIIELSTMLKNESTTASVSCTDGVGSLPADYLATERVTYNDNPLMKLDQRTLKGIRQEVITDATPWAFWTRAENLYIWPKTTASVSLQYIKLTDNYATDDDTTDQHLGKMAEQYLLFSVGAMLHLTVPDTEAYNVFSGKARDIGAKILHEVLMDDADGSPKVYAPSVDTTELWEYGDA